MGEIWHSAQHVRLALNIAGRERGAEKNRIHSGAAGGLDTGQRILEHQAALRAHSQRRSGFQENFRVRLAIADTLRAHHCAEVPP